MMQNHFRLTIVIITCLVIVGISAAVQFDFYSRKDNGSLSTPIANNEDVQIDQSFYSTSTPKRQTERVPNIIEGLTARGFLIGNAKTGTIYREYNSVDPVPVASMSKLVTAFVVTDIMKRNEAVKITEEAVKEPPDASNLMAGEIFTVDEILIPLLLNSSNVAAESIASVNNRIRFLELMSSYAWEIGMPKSYFADPSGVDPHNAASGRDMFGLAKYLVAYRPDILAITRMAEADTATTSMHGNHHFTSTHPFVRDPRFIGGKTGRTPEAGETMMTILEIGGQPIVFIVLHSDYGYREADTRLLISDFERIIRRATP